VSARLGSGKGREGGVEREGGRKGGVESEGDWKVRGEH